MNQIQPHRKFRHLNRRQFRTRDRPQPPRQFLRHHHQKFYHQHRLISHQALAFQLHKQYVLRNLPLLPPSTSPASPPPPSPDPPVLISPQREVSPASSPPPSDSHSAIVSLGPSPFPYASREKPIINSTIKTTSSQKTASSSSSGALKPVTIIVVGFVVGIVVIGFIIFVVMLCLKKRSRKAAQTNDALVLDALPSSEFETRKSDLGQRSIQTRSESGFERVVLGLTWS